MKKEATLLIPLAGAGQRFVDAGYKDPKPLIMVSKLPMIIQAARALPETTSQVFVCRDEHLKRFPLAATLSQYYPKSKSITVDHLTDGQASTCMLAKDSVNPDAALHIGACDNSMVYDTAKFDALFNASDTDAVIWTFRNNPTVKFNPKAYGWVDADAKGHVKRISCKVPISDEPMKDHAIVGSFSFKRAKDFFAATENMIKANSRVNNEFYVDHAMNFVIDLGLKVKVFEVDHYICWGTPNDLKTFEYWQTFFDQHKDHPYSLKKDPNYGERK